MEAENKTVEIFKCSICRLRRFRHEYSDNRLGERYKSCDICRERGRKNRARVKEIENDPEVIQAKMILKESKEVLRSGQVIKKQNELKAKILERAEQAKLKTSSLEAEILDRINQVKETTVKKFDDDLISLKAEIIDNKEE